jgi:hypothetical protein
MASAARAVGLLTRAPKLHFQKHFHVSLSDTGVKLRAKLEKLERAVRGAEKIGILALDYANIAYYPF